MMSQPAETLLVTPAVQEIALTHLAGFCQYAHQQHVSKQQQQQQQQQQQRGKGSRGASSTAGSASVKKGSGPKADPASAKECQESGFAALVLPPDHELATVPGGKAAVAAYAALMGKAWGTAYDPFSGPSSSSNSSSNDQSSRKGCCSECALPLLAKLVRGIADMPDKAVSTDLHQLGCGDIALGQSRSRSSSQGTASSSTTTSSASRSNGSSSSSSSSSSSVPPLCRAWSLQLLLEAVALYGSMGASAKAARCFRLLSLAVIEAQETFVGGSAELDAFRAARGGVLLRVLLLLCGRQDPLLQELQQATMEDKVAPFIFLMAKSSTRSGGTLFVAAAYDSDGAADHNH